MSAFAAIHSIGQAEARDANLPVDKVESVEHGVGSLTYVSPLLFEFFCQLELVYWHNLNQRNVDAVGDCFMKQLDAFARTAPGVTAAWKRCIHEVAMKSYDPECGEEFDDFCSEVQERSQDGFDMMLTTFRGIRGKEFTKTHAEKTRVAGDVRVAMVRDKLAAQMMVVATKASKTEAPSTR